MTTYDLEILIRTKKTGDDPSPPPESGNKWTELASKVSLAKQAFNQAGQVAKVAYDNIKAGAELGLAREQFDRLAGSIDTTADALLGKLKTATKGMASDAELVASASDIINLGLAKTEEQTIRLATASATLGLNQQQLVLTFANNSKARLDALGLSVEDVTARMEALNAQGFDGDAFDEAVLLALEDKMALLGDASQTTAGQLQILQSQLQNIKNTGQETLAEGLSPAISGLSNTIGVLNDEVVSGRSGWDNFKLVAIELAKVIDGNNVVYEQWTQNIKEGDAAIQRQISHQQRQAEEQARVTAAIEEARAAQMAETEALNESMRVRSEAAAASGEFNDKQLQIAAAQKNYNEQMQHGIVVSRGLGEATKGETAVIVDNTAAIAEARAQRALLAAQTGDLFTTFSEADGALKFFNEDLDSLGQQYVTVGGRSAEQNEDLERLQDAYDKAARTVRDYELRIKGANLTDEERADKIAEQQELMNGLTEAMTPLLGISGDLVSVNNQLTVNQDAVTKALIAGADAGGADAAQLALLKVATGELTPVQAEAVIKSVALEQTLKNLGEQYATGELTLNGYLVKAQQAVTDISNMTVAFDTQAGTINTTNAEAAALIDTLGRIPTSHDFVIKIRTEGQIPTLPSGPGGQQQAIPQQLGGPFAPGNLYRVGEGNLPEIGMLQSSGKLFMIPGERGQTFSNAQAQQMLGGYTDNSQINIVNNNLEAAATTNALVQERRRARLDAYMGVS